MKQKIISILILALLVFPVVSADLIRPGYSPIPISNKITNFRDFTNHIFVTVGEGPMCDFEVVTEGIILGQYKFCKLNVYAIEKDKFNMNDVPLDEYEEINDEQAIKDYLSNINAIKVIEDVEFYRTVHLTSPIKKINNEYEIDLDKVLIEPTHSQKQNNVWFYLYIVIPIVALLIVLLILRRRKNVYN